MSELKRARPAFPQPSCAVRSLRFVSYGCHRSSSLFTKFATLTLNRNTSHEQTAARNPFDTE
eukprot:scaffold346334_cov51-Prasinocladus_malaysianus.AAC.1